MGINLRRGQLSVDVQAAYGATDWAGLSIIGEVYDFSCNAEVDISERPAATPYGGGNFKSLKGGKYYTFSFAMDLRGTGTPGAAPDYNGLLLAAALVKSNTSGSAAVGSPVAWPGNAGTGSLTVGGTYGHTSSGKMIVEITDITTDTSITFSAKYIAAGSTIASRHYSGTQNSDTAVTLSADELDALTIDFGDPSVDTDTFAIGDNWEVPLTSSSQVDTSYVSADNPTSFNASTGPALVDIQYIEDGNRYRFADCSVNVQIAGSYNDIGKITFEGMGKYIAEAGGQSFSSPTINTTAPITFVNATLTFDGTTIPCPTAFDFNLNSESRIIPCATETQGYKGGEIITHNASLAITHEVSDFSSYNHLTELYGNSVYALTLSIGSAGNGFKITSNYAQVVAAPNEDQDGKRYTTRTFNFANPGDSNPPFTLTWF